MSLSLFTALLIALSTVSASAAVRYVSPTGDDAASGLSWEAAKRTVGAAMAGALPGDSIWVVEGQFPETITLNAGVALYGGFTGTETQLSERQVGLHITILGPSMFTPVTTPTVTVGANGGLDTVLDGFMVQSGSGGFGGLSCVNSAVTIRNCVFMGGSANRGGAAYISGSTVDIAGSVFASNAAVDSGGAIYIGDSSTAKIAGSVFFGNRATQHVGGAIFAQASTVTVSGSNFYLNTAEEHGAAISASGGTVTLVNNTVVDNTARTGSGAIHSANSTLVLGNNIVAFNTTTGVNIASGAAVNIAYNCVYGNTVGNYLGVTDPTGSAGNISVDPLLVNRAGRDLHIQETSPARDAGNNALVVDTLDIDAQRRISGAAVDIGSDELTVQVASVTVSPGTVEAGVNATGTVTLSSVAPEGGIVVTLASLNTAAATVPASVTVPEGESTATFTVTTKPVSANTAVTITASYEGVSQLAVLIVKPPATAPIYTARSIAVAPDGTVRILQTSAADARIIRVSGYTVQRGTAYPIGAGWTPVSIAAGPDGSTHLLWSHTTGLVSLWRMDASGTRVAYRALGPYSGWTAKDIAAGSDGSSRILYQSAGAVIIVNVAGGVVQFGQAYPIGTGWTAVGIAAGPGGTTHLLWRHTGGLVSLWRLNSAGVREWYQPFGPYTAWTVTDVSVAGDGTVRILAKTATAISIVKITGRTAQLGRVYPIGTDWAPLGIGAGATGKTHLLWSHSTSLISLWRMNADGVREWFLPIGPY